MNTALQAATFRALQIDYLCLLLPAAHSIHITPTSDLQPPIATYSQASGTLVYEGELWPIYALNTDAKISIEQPKQGSYCVLMDQHFGLLCDETYTISREKLVLSQIPLCMQTAELLFSGLAVYDDRVVHISTTRQLQHLINANRRN